MKLSRLFLVPLFLLHINHCSAMEIEVRPVAVLAFAAGVYASYENATKRDWQICKPFNAGIGSSLITACVMKAIEEGAKAHAQTNFFSFTPLGQVCKIVIAAFITAGFNLYLGMHKQILQDIRTKGGAYCKGLVCGCLFVLPFCSDL